MGRHKRKDIEVEARSFIFPKEFKRLAEFFNRKAKFEKEITDETVYFSGPKDLRIRRDAKNAYLILKEGKIHDKYRREREIVLKRADFGKLEDFLKALGFKVEIRWQRERRIYYWQGVKVFLDDTKGYGRIIELEKISRVEDKEKVYAGLVEMLKFLNVKITPKAEFDQKFEDYKKNWRKLLS